MKRYTVRFDSGDGDGIQGYQIVDTLTDTIVDKANTESSALEICDYYNDLEDPGALFEVDEEIDYSAW